MPFVRPSHSIRPAAAALLIAGGLLAAGPATATELPGPLVSTDWLGEHQDEVTILDVRKDTDSFHARPPRSGGGGPAAVNTCAPGGGGQGVTGHIPGASLIPWGKVRQKREVGGEAVKKLVPAQGAFQERMRAAGVSEDRPVVVMTKGEGSKDLTFATRLYWTFKYYGHDNVAVLDGGMKKWLAEDREATRRRTRADTGDFTAGEPREDLRATPEEVMAAVESGAPQLIDGRTQAFYQGLEQKPYVYAAGHVAGAKNVPHKLLYSEGANGVTWRDAGQLKQLFTNQGVNPGSAAIAFCDSGHLSTGQWFALHELLGNDDAQLFDGSMHQWTLDEDRPTSTQAE